MLFRRKGHYRLLNTLGSGACATVWHAVSLDDPTRHVALKVVRKGASDDAVRAEIALLAGLDHPNVVRRLCPR